MLPQLEFLEVSSVSFSFELHCSAPVAAVVVVVVVVAAVVIVVVMKTVVFGCFLAS